MIRVTITLLAVTLFASSCSYNMRVNRYSKDEVHIKCMKEYTAILLPDGTIIADTQGISSDLIQNLLGAGKGLAERAIGAVEYRLGDTDFKTYVEDSDE